MAPLTRVVRADDPRYPRRLLELEKPPSALRLAGEMREAMAIAVVGTRKPVREARAFATELAHAIVGHGGVVVSGGAVGIDAAAHEGALESGGATWAVAATGPDEVFPLENAALFARIADGGGAMIWPFEEGTKAHPRTFFARNGILVALADALVVVQAGVPSGALNAARWARRLGRPVWAVCAPPWATGFAGCASVVELGARPLASLEGWLRAVGLAKGRRGRSSRAQVATGITPPSPGQAQQAERPIRNARATPEEVAVVEILSTTRGQHVDEITANSGLSTQTVATVLLTLALEDVVVEGPEGFYQLANTR